jgi:RNA polymerase sigma-70 factor (ECF subfamily)
MAAWTSDPTTDGPESEGFAALACHVIVSRTSEVIDVAEPKRADAKAAAERGSGAEREPAVEQEAAFQRLANHHLDSAYRLARAILRDPAEAQDATHDAFVQAWRKWSTLHDPTAFERWFDRILVNTCRNRLQAGSRRQTTDISTELSLATRDPIGPALDRHVLADAIAGLPPDQRIVVALRFFRDLPIDEIAERLDIPSGTVQSRLHYALKRLHAAVGTAEAEGAAR